MSGTTAGVIFSPNGDDIHMQVFRGKTLNFEVIWGADSPIDVTGYEAVLQIRDHHNNLALEMSTTNGKIQMGGIDGKLTFAGSETDSRTVETSREWELELTTSAGDVYRALSGTVTPVKEIVL